MRRPIRHTDTAPGWMKREIKRLDREIHELRAAKNLQAASIGAGGVTVKDGGDLRIVDADGNPVFSALDGPLKSSWTQRSIDTTFADDAVWAEYLVTTIPIPDGFSWAIVTLFASAGISLTETGTVGVQPFINDSFGPAISNGGSLGGASAVAVSTSSMQATRLYVADDGLTLSAKAYRIGDVITGSCNVHLSAQVIFTRS